MSMNDKVEASAAPLTYPGLCIDVTQLGSIAETFQADAQITPAQVDAIISADYGEFIPRPDMSDLPDLPDLQIGNAAMLYNRTVAQESLLFVDPVSVADAEECNWDLAMREHMATTDDSGTTLRNRDGISAHALIRNDLPLEIRSHAAVHEALHLYTHHSFSREMPRMFNEGATDFFAEYSLEARGLRTEEGYPGERAHLAGLAAIVGMDTLQRAYFSGDTEAFRTHLAAAFVDGQAFASYYDAISQIPKEADAPDAYRAAVRHARQLFLDGLQPRHKPQYEAGFSFSRR
jgi:hypothetical protein